jgi:hypothetical protein
MAPEEADVVLRSLVGHAQGGDELASLVVLACLRPGLLSLARRADLRIDDVVAEAAVVVLEARLDGRRRVAAGLLLDVRHRFWERRRQERRLPIERPSEDPTACLEGIEAPGELGLEFGASEHLMKVVVEACRAGQVKADTARLIIETRVLGEDIGLAAERRGLSRKAAQTRRRRAEIALHSVVVAA